MFDEYIYAIEDEDVKMADVLEKHGLSEHTLIKNQKEFIDMNEQTKNGSVGSCTTK